MDLVKSLSHLQAAMDDPKTRQVLESLAPRLFPSSEKDAAHRGYPSSSKPAGAPVSEPAPKSAAALALPKSASNLGAAAGPSPAAGAKPAEAESVGPDQRVQAVVDKLKAGKPVPAKGFQQDPPDEVEFTSASHRASYARLARRMEKLDVSSFPQMHRLWAGSRKDQCYVGFVIFKKISIHLNNCSTIPTHGICGCASMRTSRSS